MHSARLSAFEAQLRHSYTISVKCHMRLLAQLQVLQLSFAYSILNNTFKPGWKD